MSAAVLLSDSSRRHEPMPPEWPAAWHNMPWSKQWGSFPFEPGSNSAASRPVASNNTPSARPRSDCRSRRRSKALQSGFGGISFRPDPKSPQEQHDHRPVSLLRQEGLFRGRYCVAPNTLTLSHPAVATNVPSARRCEILVTGSFNVILSCGKCRVLLTVDDELSGGSPTAHSHPSQRTPLTFIRQDRDP